MEANFDDHINVTDFSATKQMELLEDCWKEVQKVDRNMGHVADAIQGRLTHMVAAATTKLRDLTLFPPHQGPPPTQAVLPPNPAPPAAPSVNFSSQAERFLQNPSGTADRGTRCLCLSCERPLAKWKTEPRPGECKGFRSADCPERNNAEKFKQSEEAAAAIRRKRPPAGARLEGETNKERNKRLKTARKVRVASLKAQIKELEEKLMASSSGGVKQGAQMIVGHIGQPPPLEALDRELQRHHRGQCAGHGEFY